MNLSERDIRQANVVQEFENDTHFWQGVTFPRNQTTDTKYELIQYKHMYLSQR